MTALENPAPQPKKKFNLKLFLGVFVIAGGILYLLISSTLNNMQYFITVEELLADPQAYTEKQVRLSGAVIGASIQLDESGGSVRFTVANISADHRAIEASGGMAKALAAAVNDPAAPRINVIYKGLKPDLLKDQSQAIMTGKLIDANTFRADDLLLKCPTKYEGAMK